MRFCERVKIIMNENDIGQNELARMANLSSSGISAALSMDGNPRESTMMAIYDALGMSPDQFWNGNKATLDPQEKELLSVFSQLNDSGRERLIGYAYGILDNVAMRKKGSTYSVAK